MLTGRYFFAKLNATKSCLVTQASLPSRSLHLINNNQFKQLLQIKHWSLKQRTPIASGLNTHSAIRQNEQLGTQEKPPATLLSEIAKRQDDIEKARVKEELKDVVHQEDRYKKLLGKLPNFVEPYIRLMRLDRPAPIFLLYWPGAWSIIGAASYQHAVMPDFYLLSLFAAGAIATRNSGCIINDIWDREFDKQVERTKNRPLASGQIGQIGAIGLLGVNLSAALLCLFQLNLTTQVLGACCLLPIVLYPAAKRFTNWPQAMLGVTFNWSVLMGWSAVNCSIGTETQSLLTFLPAVALYAACINWTLFYDTIYAFQDRNDDRRLGIRSTALHLEKRPKLWLLGFSSLFASNMALFGWLTHQEPIFYATVALAMAHFLKQLAFLDINSAKSCGKQFNSNNTVGCLLTLGMLASIFIK